VQFDRRSVPALGALVDDLELAVGVEAKRLGRLAAWAVRADNEGLARPLGGLSDPDSLSGVSSRELSQEVQFTVMQE